MITFIKKVKNLATDQIKYISIHFYQKRLPIYDHS